MSTQPRNTVSLPKVTGPLPADEASYPFSAMAYAREPIDLAALGYVEEEFLISGKANVYENSPSGISISDNKDYCTRILVRRPKAQHSTNAWVSVLNASQGYDIEDDWRRAWDYIIAQGDIYVGVSSKPLQSSALKNFDPQRYEQLNWGGELPKIDATPGWNPFQIIDSTEEGLIWDILAQVGLWVRSGTSFDAPSYMFMMGQSQSAIYTNTYLTHFHTLLKSDTQKPLFDGYLPGVGSIFTKALNQHEEVDHSYDLGGGFIPLLTEPIELDVPVIRVSSEGDTELFPGGPEVFRSGDGEMSRHWHVAASPHSDPRSRVIPANSQVEKAGRLPRDMTQEFLESVSVFPIEAVITASMAAISSWASTGTPAAPSIWFEKTGDAFLKDASHALAGGVRLGLLEEPLAIFHGATPGNAVLGTMELYSAAEVLNKYENLISYQQACDVIDDQLEAAGYLEPHGRKLLHAVEQELWERAVEGATAPLSTPQAV